MLPELLKSVVGSIVRWALTGVFAYLASRGVIKPEDSEQLLVGIGGALVVLIWSLWQKYSSRLAFLAALNLPAGSPEDDVKRSLRTDKPTVWGVAVGLMMLGSSLAFSGCGDQQRKAEEGMRKVYVGLQAASDAADEIYQSKLRKLDAAREAGQIPDVAYVMERKGLAQENLNAQEAIKKVATGIKLFKERVRSLSSVTADNKLQLIPFLDLAIADVEKARQAGLIGVSPEKVTEIELIYELLKSGVVTLKGVIGAIKQPVPTQSIPALVQ